MRGRVLLAVLASGTMLAGPAHAEPLDDVHRSVDAALAGVQTVATCEPDTSVDVLDLRDRYRVIADLTYTNISYVWRPWVRVAAVGPCVKLVRLTLRLTDSSGFTDPRHQSESHVYEGSEAVVGAFEMAVVYYSSAGVRQFSAVDLEWKAEYMVRGTTVWKPFSCGIDDYQVAASPPRPIFWAGRVRTSC